MTSPPLGSDERPDIDIMLTAPPDGTAHVSATSAPSPADIETAAAALASVQPGFADYAELLEQDFDSWAKVERRASHTALYKLLAQCLHLYELTAEDTEDGARLRAEGDRYAAGLKLKFKADTHPAVRIVRIIFRSDRKLASAHGAVLRAAIDAGVKHDGFVAFVEQKGGIEKIRTGKSTSKREPTKTRGQRTWETLRDTTLAVASGESLRSATADAKVYGPVILLATRLASGDLEIHAVVDTEGAVYAAYAAHASADVDPDTAAEQDHIAKRQTMAELRAKAAREALAG